jgi:hypothetical protein
MSNLSDLLPAGAGGKQFSFTASGAISQGDSVILNGNGTVSTPTNQSESITSPASLQNDIDGTATVYDASEDRFVTAFRNRVSSNRLEVRAGSLSGTTITWGTAQNASVNCNEQNTRIASDGSGGFLILFENSSDGHQYAVAGTVSGSTITLGTASKFTTSSYGLKDVAYDANSGKYVIVFIDNSNSLYGTAIVATVTGTSVSYGSDVVFDSNTLLYSMRCVYDSTNQKIVVVDARTGRFSGFIGTVSGTSTSWTSAFDNTSTRPQIDSDVDTTGLEYDSGQEAILFTFSDADDNDIGKVCAATVTSTTITWGSLTAIDGSTKVRDFGLAYDSAAKKIVVGADYGDTTRTGKYFVATLTGNSVSIGTSTQFESTEPSAFSAAFSTAALKTAIIYDDQGDSDNGKYVVQQNQIQNYTDFIGIADAAISDTASGNITIKGGVASNGLSSLTPGSTYYVQNDGSLSTTSSSVTAGKALSATSINLDYSS